MTPSWVATRDIQLPDDVASILQGLPEWFGRPESTAEYIEAARSMETWSVRSDGMVVGVMLVVRHFPQVAEIHLMAVRREQRGAGIGRVLISALEQAALHDGVQLLEVKTLGRSHPDPGYAQTRAFYEGVGFLPLEETELWGPGTPCLIMVKPLG